VCVTEPVCLPARLHAHVRANTDTQIDIPGRADVTCDVNTYEGAIKSDASPLPSTSSCPDRSLSISGSQGPEESSGKVEERRRSSPEERREFWMRRRSLVAYSFYIACFVPKCLWWDAGLRDAAGEAESWRGALRVSEVSDEIGSLHPTQ